MHHYGVEFIILFVTIFPIFVFVFFFFMAIVVLVLVVVGVFTVDINLDDSTKQFVQILVPTTTTFLLPEDNHVVADATVVVRVVGGCCSCSSVLIDVIVRHLFFSESHSFLDIKQRTTTETVHTSLSCNNLGFCRCCFFDMACVGSNEER